MRVFWVLLVAILLGPQSGAAQSTTDQDKGFLVNLIEENLSGVSRTVSITGFEGALSSAATLDVMTIADNDGVWLTLEDVSLIWNRAALLRGRIDIEDLSAERIILARQPVSDAPIAAPEAAPFSLPELPVGIQIDNMSIGAFILGPTFLGKEETFALSGRAQLAGGEGNFAIEAARLGESGGNFEVSASYSNATEQLTLAMLLDEPADGIVANVLGLPNVPSVKLSLAGDAPIKNFGAALKLSTNDQERLVGQFELQERNATTAMTLEVKGDITSLFAPDYQAFFGPEVALSVVAMRTQDQRVILQDLNLDADAIALQGRAELAANGWPTFISLTGDISNREGGNVLLPLAGGKKYVDRVSLNVGYDEAISDDWNGEFSITGFEQPGIYIRDLTLIGGGQIVPADGLEIGAFNAQMTYQADGFQLDDTAASDALGDIVHGEIDARYIQNQAFQLPRLTMSGAGIEIALNAEIETVDETLLAHFNADAQVERLSRFSTLAGRDLDGAAHLKLNGTAYPLSGGFDVSATGQTQNLTIGIAQADAVLAGTGVVELQAQRDADGIHLETFEIETPQAAVTANASFTSQDSSANARISLSDIALIDGRINGPFVATANLTSIGLGQIQATIDASIDANSFTIAADAVNTPQGYTINFESIAQSPDIGVFSKLAARRISGSMQLATSGVVLADGQRFDANMRAETMDIGVGIDEVDALFAGQGALDLNVSHLGNNSYRISDFALNTDGLSVLAEGEQQPSGDRDITLRAVVSDAKLIAQQLSGEIVARLNAKLGNQGSGQLEVAASGDSIRLDALLDLLPEGDTFRVSGDIKADLAEIAPFARIAGVNYSGGIRAGLSGSILSDLSEFDAAIDANTSRLAIGHATLDKLLAGNGRLEANANFMDGQLRVPNARADFPNFQADGTLTRTGDDGLGEFNVNLRDIGLFTEQLSGNATANGTARLTTSGNWAVDARATGPGDMTVATQGTIQSDNQLNLEINGALPLAIANNLLAPRLLEGAAEFDLSVIGPASLGSVSGAITTQNARLSAPTLGESLTGIQTKVALNQGRAQVDLKASVRSGGNLTVSGPINLSGDANADLAIKLNGIRIKDAALYETIVSGNLSAQGPLTGGAEINGALRLGNTEIRVPSSSIGTLGDLPNVTHINANADVVATLKNAGALDDATEGSPSDNNRPEYPLNITISAPSRIFVRGRGLDAELGGALRIGGTSNDVIPSGVFELVRGRLDILQQRFELTEGSASVQGDFAPIIRLVAQTEATTGTVIRIVVEGPATEPQVRFESIPELPQDEVLSQLIFGRDLASISPLQAVQLAAAVNSLSGRGGGSLLSDFRSELRLDELDITTDDQGNAAVRAGAYLSKNVYTDVTVSTDGTTDININLDITSEITAKGSAGADGETSIGIFFEKDY